MTIIAALGCAARRNRKQKQSDSEDELYQRTASQLDEIVAEFHALLPRDKATAIGAIYARYSTKFQDSIADQVRALFEDAVRKNVFVPRELVFFDTAARSYSNRRPGLMALREAISKKEMGVVLVFATNRLFRKMYKALQFVEEEIVEQGIRCIFAKSKIDTADDEKWRTMLNICATMDEFVIGMYSDHIRAAHEGLFLRRMVCNKLAVGYTGEPIEGEFTKRKKPRKRVVIDPKAAHYVKLIFEWFVVDRLPIDEIIRRLNSDPNAPLPVDSTSGMWGHQTLCRLLQNASYRGYWEYGKTEAKWLSKKDYVRQFPRAEPLKAAQFEELRIVSDEIWYAAQVLLLDNKNNSGRKPKDGNRVSRPRLLNGLFWCPEHERPLHVSGTFGRAMQCAACRATETSKRPLVSTLNRKLALKLTCSTIARLIRADDNLAFKAIAACRAEAERLQKPDPAALANGKAEEGRLRRQMRLTIETMADSNEAEAEARDLHRDLRNRLAEVVSRNKQIEAGIERQIRIPAEEDVRQLLRQLENTLLKAAEVDEVENAAAAREIINTITAGRISLFQMGERKAKRGWLQGRFKAQLLRLVVSKCTGIPVNQMDENEIEVTIDYQRPSSIDEEATYAWQFHKDGWANKRIAKKLGCGRSKVTKLLRYAATKLGEILEDGRKQGNMIRLEENPPLHRRIAADVQKLWDEGLLIDEIAARTNCQRTTVKKIISDWYTSRGLPVPDGRTRRKTLARKQARPRKSA